MFERFNEDARRVLYFARYEASQLGSVSIETEHLLLGLILEPGGVTSLVFARTRLPLELIRREIKNRTRPRQNVASNVEITFSAATKRVIHQHAAREADRLGHNKIDAAHPLLGILNEEGCIAASVLRAQGMRLDPCREEIVRARNEGERSSDSTTTEQVTQKWYARPVLFVRDLEVALCFYIDKLGFKKKWHSDDGKGTVCQVDRGECEVILCEDSERQDKGRLFVELTREGIDELRREILERAVATQKGWWGYSVIRIADPDGNELLFPLDETNDGERDRGTA